MNSDISETTGTQGTTNHKSGVVAIIGPPNAGKSTLLNQMLGQKVAIVTPKPQTTRNRISGIFTRDDAQVVFLDTPGVHQSRKALNRFLVESAWQALYGADAVLLLLDASLYADKPQLLQRDLGHIRSRLQDSGLPLVIALNKIDRLKDKQALLPVLQELNQAFPGHEVHTVSATRGEGVRTLLESVIRLLPQGPSYYPEDQISTMPLRFMASEIIREKLFLALGQELPYTVAVDIEDWAEDSSRNIVHVSAVIYVARAAHKPMVIGKGGSLLKRVGQQSRIEIQELTETRVNLNLWVKVRPKWDRDARFMSSLGLGA